MADDESIEARPLSTSPRIAYVGIVSIYTVKHVESVVLYSGC